MRTNDRLTPEKESHFRDWATSHTAVHPGELLAEIDALRQDIAAAEARGFERAREKAAGMAAKYSTYAMTYDEKHGARVAQDDIETAIRAMKDETT